jgi:hypothetical protein
MRHLSVDATVSQRVGDPSGPVFLHPATVPTHPRSLW